MLFNSTQFAIFLPVVFSLFWLIPNKYRWLLLLCASYYFYMCWNVQYVVLILFVTVVSFLSALFIEWAASERLRKYALFFSFCACLGTLFVFKYFNFFYTSAARLADCTGMNLKPISLGLLLPVGISFYTFQSLSYVVDVYRGEAAAEHHFGIYATFVSFFPQLVAGPIERTNNLLPQLKIPSRFHYSQASYGLKLMAWGYFKKLVIADNISVYVDTVFDEISSFHGFALILAAFFFTVQIYCDFSAYSDIARGTAKLLGIELMENFRTPYFSANLHEFWNRWHISLSTWFRDYIYIPLGGNRVGKLKHSFNLLITFLISGLWHGANWTFVIWGGIHGLAQIVENRRSFIKKKKEIRCPWILGVLFVFLFSMFTWVFFRAKTIDDALYFFRHMFDGISHPHIYISRGFSAREHVGIGADKTEFLKVMSLLFLLAVYDFASLKNDVIDWLSQQPVFIRWSIYITLTWLIILFAPRTGNAEFVYFQF